MSTIKMYNHDFELFASSDDFASLNDGSLFAAKAPTAYSNAFAAQPQLRAVDDAALDSPLGFSPLSLATSSPFDASFAEDTSPMISGTPDFITDDVAADMPSLFEPWPTTVSLPLVESDRSIATTEAAAHQEPAPSVSPLVMTLDGLSPQYRRRADLSSAATEKESVEDRIARARQVAQQVLSEDNKPVKDKFTGTRNTKIPLIDMEAPTMSRSWVIPATTSRKRAPASLAGTASSTSVGEKQPKQKKQRRNARAPSLTPSSTGSAVMTPDEAEQLDDLPDELLTAIELKRRQNTLAARRSRQRKANHLAELNGQIDALQAEVDDWKSKCAQLEALVQQLRGESA